MPEEEVWDQDPDELRPVKKKRRRKPSKAKEVVIEFNELSRKDFVTGFQRRKQARRKVAKQQQDEQGRARRVADRKMRRDAFKQQVLQGVGDEGVEVLKSLECFKEEEDAKHDAAKSTSAQLESVAVLTHGDARTTTVRTTVLGATPPSAVTASDDQEDETEKAVDAAAASDPLAHVRVHYPTTLSDPLPASSASQPHKRKRTTLDTCSRKKGACGRGHVKSKGEKNRKKFARKDSATSGPKKRGKTKGKGRGGGGRRGGGRGRR